MTRRRTTALLWIGLGLSLGLALFLSPWASPDPDGLDKSAAPLGLHEAEVPHGALLPDYDLPGRAGSFGSRSAAGAIGTLAAFALVFGLTQLIGLSRRTAPPEPHP